MKLLKVLGLSLLGLALSACARQGEEGVTIITYATAYSPNHPFSRADQVWMDYVKEESGGTLIVRPYWAGSLLSESLSMTEVRHGVADVGLIMPIYTLGGAHLLRAQSGFYSGARGFQQQTELYRCMEAAGDPFAEELEGLKVLALQGGNNPGIVTRNKPVKTLADLEGMRIRAPSELLPVLRTLGADPVDMPMGEVYSALAKGVIDGVIAPAETYASLHFHEVSHYFTELNVPRSAYPARAMSMRTWDALTTEHRALLERSAPVWEQAIFDTTLEASDRGYKIGEEGGIEYLNISQADQAEFDRIYLEEAEKTARSVSRFGIDAMPIFRVARASVQSDGSVVCEGMGS